MKKFALLCGTILTALLLFVAFSVQAPDTADANGATVLNHPDGLQCFFIAAGGLYNGPATLVATPSGNVNGQCNASVIAGSAVGSNTQFTAVFNSPFGPITGSCVLNKAGNGNCSFHN